MITYLYIHKCIFMFIFLFICIIYIIGNTKFQCTQTKQTYHLKLAFEILLPGYPHLDFLLPMLYITLYCIIYYIMLFTYFNILCYIKCHMKNVTGGIGFTHLCTLRFCFIGFRTDFKLGAQRLLSH